MRATSIGAGAIAAVLTIIVTIAIRRLLLVPVFHVTEVTWSTAFVAFVSFVVLSRVVQVVITVARLNPEQRRDATALSQALGAPVDRLRDILRGDK